MRSTRLGVLAALIGAGAMACSPDSDAPNESTASQCVSSDPLVAVDHVTLAVRDLDATREQVRDLGFRIKDGRLHSNGILNAHVKTPAGSLELLSVSEGAGTLDDQSSEYVDFIRAGEGGAFLALGGAPVDSVARRLDALGLDHPYSIERGVQWDYLTFPKGSPLRHVYFFAPNRPVQDDASPLTHLNGASALSAILLDGGPQLMLVLQTMGGVVCERDDQNTRMRLGDAALTLRTDESTSRGRVHVVEFQVFTLGRPPAEVSGLTIGWAPPS